MFQVLEEVYQMQPVICFDSVSKQYGEKEASFYALEDVSFSIYEGEYVVILGPSGAGKSTLLNLLGGMDSATSGSILVEGQPIEHYDDQKLTKFRAEKVGFVFQFYNLIPSLTAVENVAITKDIRKSGWGAEAVLKAVHLDQHMDQFPSQLSGGEQQRVSIARAISKNPLMLLCDEPTGALDSNTGVDILKLLHDLCKKEHKTVIIVTHNAALAPSADRVIYLKNGKIERMVENEHPIKIDEVNW